LGTPEVIGPAGTKITGRWPNASPPITRPGTILSQTPSIRAPSKASWVSAMEVAMAMTSRENRDSSMPGRPWVTPSHMAGTPPANWAVAPISRAACLMMSGKRSKG
jgi:hypothetical protein